MTPTARDNFTLESKSLSSTLLESGDLLIEGWAASFEGLDRQNENFIEGAFRRGVKAFLEGRASLNYHHKHDANIGKVLELKEVPGKGLWMKARVDKQERTSPLFHVYNGIRKGSITGLSVGGFFKRTLTAGGWRIADMDFTEISCTPVPTHGSTGFSVVSGKALPSGADLLGANLALARAQIAVFQLEHR